MNSVESNHAPVPSLANVPRLLPLEVLLLSAWFGLAGGLLEVGTRVLFRIIDPAQRLYLVSRHFIWLGPLSNLLLLLGIGLLLAVATKFWPRAAGWLSPRLILACTILPALMAASREIYPEAWLVLALGIATQLVPVVERHRVGLKRKLSLSFPVMVGVVACLASLLLVGDRLKERREAGRPMPPANSPNVLLIVLDTLRADHLSLYGYERSTTPNLDRIAKQGIRFDEARATAPWTLPSHASMFTGRWPHDLVEKWMTPLYGNFPTLAEFIGAHGYATAGFVANVVYCSYDTGLDRGFTHYEDYVLEGLASLRTSGLVDYAFKILRELSRGIDRGTGGLARNTVNRWLSSDRRKDAASISRAFLDWSSFRRQKDRPFFAFLNFIDAHASYIPPPGARHRFGTPPQTPEELQVVYELWPLLDKTKLPRTYINLGNNSYDDCLGYLDDQLGLLFDELERRGVLDQTLIVVTSDHGEGLGEHDLFDHGESLYRTEIRVPLVIVPPRHGRAQTVIRQAVSLRNLPATIVDLLGLKDRSPFPGGSLASLWRDPSPRAASVTTDPVMSELANPNPVDPNHGRSPARRGPLIAVADGDFVYIRNQRDGSEELFNERDDPRELTDRARARAFEPILQQFRSQLSQIQDECPRSAK
jgi:arylsulfatase A-like enzyme